jgi:uncharacterized protein (DUF1778 family)
VRLSFQGRTLTDFVVSSVHEATVRTIEEMQIIRLSAEDRQTSAEALLNPPTAQRKAPSGGPPVHGNDPGLNR